MSTKVVMDNVNFFPTKEAYDAYLEGNTIPNTHISFVGNFGLIPSDLDWKEAYVGSMATINTVVCTLPSTWKEVIIRYDWFSGGTTDSFMVVPRTGLDVTKRLCPSDDEIYVVIDNLNQVKMVDRGDTKDASLTGVYYR